MAFDDKNCPIVKRTRERVKQFFLRNNGIKEVRLEDLRGKLISCQMCNSNRFKLYTKFGGTTYGKNGKVVNSVPVKYNFACGCGKMLVVIENTFKYTKVKYGCGTNICPKEKTKMDKDCLKCEFIYEK